MRAPQAVLERPLFTVGESTFRWEDVVRAGDAWGDLPDLEGRAGEGVAALARVEAEGPALDEGEVDEAATAFRLERSLLAAEEMEAWLARWELRAADWLDHIRRQLARERHPGERNEALEVDEILWAEIVFSGTLASLAEKLAGRAAAAAVLGRRADGDPDALEQAFQDFVRQVDTPDERAKLLEARKVDWLRVECALLELPEEGMAREATLLAREDRMPLAEVAAQAGTGLTESSFLLGETGRELSEPLLSGAPGDVVGPVATGTGFIVAAIRAKQSPTLDDPAVQERLGEELPRRAVSTEVNNLVKWHERP